MIPSLLGVLFASSLFLAQPVAGLEKRLAATAFTQTTCRTYLTTKSTTATTSTTSLVVNLNPIVLYTKTPSTTLTPQATTTTTTTTLTATTTAPVVTDTFSSTTTMIVSTTETDTVTISQTETDTVTSTAATTTSTVPIPDGFIVPTPTSGGKKRGLSPAVQANAMVKKSSEIHEARAAIAFMPPRCKGAKTKYPYKVVCTQLVESIRPIAFTLTAKRTTTITATTPTLTVTASVTTTTTIYVPDASTTSTFSETDTMTSTVLVTQTQSQTVTSTVTYQPTSTYYAQCGAQNQVSTDSFGSQLALLDDNGPNNQIFYTADAYSCCAACATTANCAGSNWIPSFGSSNCELVIYNSCPANQGQLADSYASNNQLPTIFSNGPCGYFLYVSS